MALAALEARRAEHRQLEAEYEARLAQEKEIAKEMDEMRKSIYRAVRANRDELDRLQAELLKCCPEIAMLIKQKKEESENLNEQLELKREQMQAELNASADYRKKDLGPRLTAAQKALNEEIDRLAGQAMAAAQTRASSMPPLHQLPR